MSDKKLGQEPAFPTDPMNSAFPEWNGMSKRFYAACAAMQGMLANPAINASDHYNNETIIGISYAIADELLKQENNE